MRVTAVVSTATPRSRTLLTGWLILAIATAAGLLYTHSQVQLVDQSYVLSERLQRRDVLHEQYAYLAYEVMAMKAPNRLKERLAACQVELKPPKATETLAAPMPAPSAHRWTPAWLRATEAEARSE